MDEINRWMSGGIGATVAGMLVLILAVVAVTIFHKILFGMLRGAAARSRTNSDDIIFACISAPLKWVLILIGLGFAQRAIPSAAWIADIWERMVGLVLPALLGWLAISLIRASRDIINTRADISVEDNLQARRRRTKVGILSRIAILVVLFMAIGMTLLSIPGVRSVGVTLMASAGLAAIAVGAAAQPALKNLIAGIQMAFTEPIRIDDVVIVDGEWGRIEDIRLTYVVINLWDERRLVVPVTKFLEDSFQNWTRQTSRLLGSAFLYVDPTADIPRIRAKLGEVVQTNPKWDKRFFKLQVTDITEHVMELRALMTASDASRAFDLRCDIREALMGFIAKEMPEALPRRRQEAFDREAAGRIV